jgi:hypothetical protein
MMFYTLLSARLTSTIRDMLLLGGNLSSDRLGEIHDPRRLRIRRPQMFGKKCNPSVIAETPVTEIVPVPGSELNKYHRPEVVKHPADDRARGGVILEKLILRGRKGHAIRFTSARVEVSTGAPHVSGFFADERELRRRLSGHASEEMHAVYTHHELETIVRRLGARAKYPENQRLTLVEAAETTGSANTSANNTAARGAEAKP